MRRHEETRRYRSVSRDLRERLLSEPRDVRPGCRTHAADSWPTRRYNGAGYRDRLKHSYR